MVLRIIKIIKKPSVNLRINQPILKLRPFQTYTKHFITSDPTLTTENLSEIEISKVKKYWENIDIFRREPGQLIDPTDMTSTSTFNPSEVKELISKVINNEVEKRGDILLSLDSQTLCKCYESFSVQDKIKFCILLQEEFGLKDENVMKACNNYLNDSKDSKNSGSLKAVGRLQLILRHSLVPQYTKVFDSVVQLPTGMKYLVNFRQDIIYFIQHLHTDSVQNPGNLKVNKDKIDKLKIVSDSLKFKLQSWLVGFQDLQRLTWFSPAFTLEKLFQYEKVHRFKGWDDLKQRVGPGRRIFGFFHKSLPLDPLVYVQVALLDSISSNVQSILNAKDPAHPTTDTVKVAVFYSINTQSGLTGVDLGSFLIKRVVSTLQKEFPYLKTFCTLSPIPKLRTWLMQTLKSKDNLQLQHLESYLDQSELILLNKLRENSVDKWDTLADLLSSNAWIQDSYLYPVIKPILMRIATYYLLEVKKNGFPYDPVASFHLRNGACVHRINWMGDTSDKGVQESFGIMVNYNYLLEFIELNNQSFLTDHNIAISADSKNMYFERYLQDGRVTFRNAAN